MTSPVPKPPQIDVAQEHDLLLLRLEGDYTLEVAMYVQTYLQQMGDKYGYRLNLIDVTKAGTITHDARRFLLEQRRRTKLPGVVAIVGATFTARTLAQMILRALQALTKVYAGVGFFADEIAARDWIELQRPRLHKDTGKTLLT